jgi:hypothetical protein
VAGLAAVPGPDAAEHELSTFALTYNGYTVHHDLEAIVAIARAVEEEWSDGALTTDVDQLRATLFYYQRQGHWNDGPGLADRPVVTAILQQLRHVCPNGVPQMESI